MALRTGEFGVKAADLAAQRAALIEFAEEMYGSLARCDQRAKGEQYVRGLLLEGRRKSIQPMAARLPDGDQQGLQQFITDSPWDDMPVRRRLARRMTAEIEPEGWVIDDTGLPKDGRFSPGVAHQYCGALGKTANCQVIVSVNAATDRASCPLGWRLFLPEAWDQDEQRRAKAKIPDDVRHAPKWQLALDIVDEVIAWGLPARVVQADGGYGDITAFRIGLEERELSYVVQVKGTTSAQRADTAPVAPAYQGRGRPPVARYPDKPVSLRALALTAGQASTQAIGWREGDRGPLSSRFSALRVRPANDAQRQHDGVLPERWLLAEWPAGKDEPVKYWLSNLPADTSLQALVRAAKLRWRVEHDYRELKQCLGLDHYEGRTYRGLHHHLTCVTVAHAFLTTCRLHRDPGRPQTAAA
ncbi:MAG TPA: IS701 family transposase [Candidatus Limnocylindrales bacterium]|nr:IS701 family transposase [Candidatus Limnocylindrales bacterium]